MAHPENESHHALLVEQTEAFYRESFRMAEHIVLEAAERFDWKSIEAKENYISSIPMVALQLKGELMSIAHMAQQASPREIDAIHESVSRVVEEMKKRNNERDKKV